MKGFILGCIFTVAALHYFDSASLPKNIQVWFVGF